MKTIDALAGHMVDIVGEIYFEDRSVEEVEGVRAPGRWTITSRHVKHAA